MGEARVKEKEISRARSLIGHACSWQQLECPLQEEESEAMEYCTCNIVIHVTLCYNILLLYSAHPCTGSGGSCPRKCRLQEKEDIYCTCAKLMPSSARNSTREFGITFNK